MDNVEVKNLTPKLASLQSKLKEKGRNIEWEFDKKYKEKRFKETWLTDRHGQT